MKVCRYRQIADWTGLAVITALLLWPAAGYAETTTKKEPIQVSAQTLVADDARKFAEFIGNVKAVQGNTEIRADRLKIFYENASGKGNAASAKSGQDSITSVEATGNVNIRFGDMVAESQKAVYTTGDRVLVLSGPDSKVTQPRSGTISGSKITVQRDTGKIKFEGGVQGTFFPGEKGLE